jgi:hypothetical protein
MKLDICWRKVSMFGQRLVGRLERRTVPRAGSQHPVIKQHRLHVFFTSRPRRPQIPRYQPLPVKHDPLVVEHYVPCQTDDSFSAQLRACRDQTWWNQQPDVHGSHAPACADTNDSSLQPAKRSLSIRDIRERMSSDRQSVTSSKIGSDDWEPGLKFLDGVRGGWRDMETFPE